MSTTTVQIGNTIQCPHCFMAFWVTEEFETARRRDHGWFFCPIGHNLHFPAKSDAEQAREQRDKAWVERDRAERERDEARQQIARMERRHKHGVCLYCKRRFGNLAAHMKSKHAEPKKK